MHCAHREVNVQGRRRVGLLTLAMTALLPLSAPGFAQGRGFTGSTCLDVGEDLIYNVRYGPIDLGQIRIQVLSSWTEAGRKVYHCRGLIDSYKGIPFVSLHAIYESVIDSAIYSWRFTGKTKDGDHWNFGRYFYAPGAEETLIEMGRDSLISRRDTLHVTRPAQDGLSLFFFARENLFADSIVTVPAIVSEKLVNTRIDFRDDPQSVEIDEIDHPVDVLHFEGSAEFVGLYGMTGDFEGWFSNDAARIPIMAKVHVLIGSVTIELMKWTHPGWDPPRGKG